MNEDNKKKKGLLVWIIGGAAVLAAGAAAVLILTLGRGGAGNQDPSGQDTQAAMSEAERILSEQLAAPGDAVVTLDEDITLTQILTVEGNKTLAGSGTLRSSGGLEYAISVSENASFTLDGPQIDCEGGATNGIYGAPGSTVTLSSGGFLNTEGHCMRILGKAFLNGGSVSAAGTNWLMLDDNAEAEITGTKFSDSGSIGVITGKGSKLTVRNASMENSADNMIYTGADSVTEIDGGSYSGAGNYVFYNGGAMTAKNLKLSGAKILGYFENGAGASLTVSDTEMRESTADFVYNQGALTMNDVTLDTCTNTALETKGSKAVVELNRVRFSNVGQHVLLVKGSEVNMDTVESDQCGSYFCSNRSGKITGKNVKTGKCGGAGFYNELLSDNDLPGTISLDGFEIGETGTYGIRMNSGSIELKNGVVGKAVNYGLYVKDGKADVTNVEFKGMLVEGRAVIMNGYNTNIKGVVTMTDCKVTGGARGITNHAVMTLNNCEIYGNRSSGGVHTGAAVSNDRELTINGGYFHDNHASSSGGAVYSVGTCTIGGGVVIADNSSETSGGGVANSVSADGSHKGVMKIRSCTIRGNYAENYGGGVFNKGTMTMSSGTVRNNTCGKGGGGMENTGKVTLSGGTIRNNKSTASGGGFYNGTSGTAELSGVTISGNSTGSDASSGGVHNLGKMSIKSGTRIINNTAANYGGGVTNSITTDGTKGGTMTISGGTISGNSAGKGGGGVYNRYNMTISGGTVTGNTTGTNGACVYNSGDITIKGGTMKDYPDGKPYDVYIYKGNLNLQGSPDIGSVYKAATGTVTVAGTMGDSVNYFMNSYATGEQALLGTSALIGANKGMFVFPEGSLSDKQYIDDKGRIAEEGVDLDKIEAELWIGGKKVDEGLLSLILQSVKNDTQKTTEDVIIKVVDDAVMHSTLDIRYLPTEASGIDGTKTYTLTDDGTAHTITVSIPGNPAFYVAASGGGDGNSASSSGYYRGTSVLNITGNAGLTFKSSGESTSAGVLVATNGLLKTSGKVTFEGFVNTSEGGLDTGSASTRSSGKNGGAVYVSASGAAELDGTVFTGNKNTSGNCAGVYAGGRVALRNCTFSGNEAVSGNGGAVYITSTSVFSATGCSFDGNKAVSGGAVYAFQNTSYPVISDCVFTGNKADGEASAVYLSSDCTMDIENVTTAADDTSVSSIKLNSGSSLRIGGKLTADWIDLGSTLILKKALSSGSSLAIKVADENYTEGYQVIKAEGASEEELSAAVAAITLTNDNSKKELRLGDDGKLFRYVAKTAELHRADILVMTDTLENVAAAAEELDRIVLTGTADIVNDITLNVDVTIMGEGNTIRSDGGKLIVPAGRRLRLEDVTIPVIDLAGTLEPADTFVIKELNFAENAMIEAVSAPGSGSSIGLNVADEIFAAGTQIMTKHDAMSYDEFFAAVDAVSIRNVNTDDLIISKDTETLGQLVVNTKPNAELTRGEEVTEGKFNVFMLSLHDGDKIRLLEDVELSQMIEITSAVELDGDGHTITLKNENSFFDVTSKTETVMVTDPVTNEEKPEETVKNGSLTITGDLTVAGSDGVVLGSAAVNVSSGGKLIAKDGILTVKNVRKSESGAGLYVAKGAEALLDNAVFENCVSERNGGAIYAGGTVTMNGGSITGSRSENATGGGGAVYISTDGVLTLDGTEITGCSANYNGGAIYNYFGTLALKGDTAISGCSVGSGRRGTVLYSATNAKNVISGGTYSGSLFAYCAADGDFSKIEITGGKFSSEFGTERGSIVISGGYFAAKPADKYVAYWHECVEDSTYEGYGYTVKEMAGEMTDPVASIGDRLFGTIEEALRAAAEESEAVTVKLIADCSTAGGIMTSADGVGTTEGNTAGITIDLNGHTISVSGEQFIRSKTMLVIDDTSEGKNGRIAGTGTSTNVNGFLYQNVAKTLTIKAGTIEAEGSRVVAGSGYKAANIVMTGGTIINRSGGVALRVNTSSAEISGGYIEGKLATGSSGSISVSGGSFDHDPSAYVDSNHEAVLNTATSCWDVTGKASIANAAEIDGTEYLTIDDALKAAAAGNSAVTVRIIADCTTDGGIMTSSDGVATTEGNPGGITIDLNGHTVTVTGEQFIRSKTTLTIDDSSDGKSGRIVGTGTSTNVNGFLYQNIGRTLTIKAGTIEAEGSRVVAGSGYKAANIVMTGGTIINRSGGVVLRVNTSGAEISAGTVRGKLAVGSSGSIEVSGGTFDNDPSAYVDTAAYDVINNGNGTWTVQAK